MTITTVTESKSKKFQPGVRTDVSLEKAVTEHEMIGWHH